MTDKLLVIPGSRNQFEQWVKHRINRDNYFCCLNAESLHGKTFRGVYYVGTWFEHAERHEIDRLVKEMFARGQIGDARE